MATKQQTATSAITDIQSLFDPRGYQDVLNAWVQMNERVTGLMFDTATKTTEIAQGTTQEALSNMREVSQLRDEPAEYGKATSDFVQKQMELFTRTAQSVSDVTQKSASAATELVTEAGQQMGDTAAANAQGAADRATSAAKKAA